MYNINTEYKQWDSVGIKSSVLVGAEWRLYQRERGNYNTSPMLNDKEAVDINVRSNCITNQLYMIKTILEQLLV